MTGCPQCNKEGSVLSAWLVWIASRSHSPTHQLFDAPPHSHTIYRDWPTIPQLYVSGEFVGGCDIVTQMHENGELKELLEEIPKEEKV